MVALQSPGLTNDVHGFRFQASTPDCGRGGAQQREETESLRIAVNDCENLKALHTLIYPGGLFDGFQNEDATYNTIKEWLNEIIDDPKDHLKVCANQAYSLRHHMPSPIVEAVMGLALANGWHPEAVMLLLESNISFMEHHASKIAEKNLCLHQISPAIAVFLGAEPSARKSSLIKWSTEVMTKCESAPESFKTSRIFMGDATLKGIRNAIFNDNRASVTTCEGVNSYETLWSEKSSGSFN